MNNMLFEKGLIKFGKEYKIGNKNENTKELPKIDRDKILEKKLNDEINEFKKFLLTLSKEEIMVNSYEFVCKMEIKDMLNRMNLIDAEKEMLFLQDKVLDSFYWDWLEQDVSLGESMENGIEETLITVTKNIGRRDIKHER